jgi:hypothetical protein
MKSWQGMKKLFYNIAAPVSASGRDIAPITLREVYQGVSEVREGGVIPLQSIRDMAGTAAIAVGVKIGARNRRYASC